MRLGSSSRLRLATVIAGLLLVARPGRAADVAVLGSAANATASSQTLRIPSARSVAVDGSGSGYIVAGVALSGTASEVGSVTVTLMNPTLSIVRPLARQTIRDVDNGGLSCRSELWGVAIPAGFTSAFINVTSKAIAGNAPTPTMIGSVVSFSNVASTSLAGPCCYNSGNSGDGVSTITKTMAGTSRGDALFNSVCTNWPTGATPGLPMPDPAVAPEMVRQAIVTTVNYQHFIGVSPGADVLRPATSYRHLRWLQSGSRAWALVGIMLLATDTPNVPDAGVPGPDSAPPPPVDAAGPVDTSSPASDVAPLDAGSTPGEVRPDGAGPGSVGDAPAAPGTGDAASRPPDAGLPDVDAGASGAGPINWRVGCACALGSTRGDAGGAATVVVLGLLLLALRRTGRTSSRTSPEPSDLSATRDR